jgi:hypothetical protein
MPSLLFTLLVIAGYVDMGIATSRVLEDMGIVKGIVIAGYVDMGKVKCWRIWE